MIADEAHRTQYGFKAKVDGETGQIKYGLAKSLRDALQTQHSLHLLERLFLKMTETPKRYLEICFYLRHSTGSR